MRAFFTLLFAVLASGAHADVKVIYFGGYGSTASNLACWKANAQAQRPGVSFEVHGYPGGSYRDRGAIASNGEASIAAVLAEIKDRPQTHFIIVGHSSGSPLADAVAARVKNPSQIELINLEGFTTPASIQNRVKTRCFYAYNTNGVPTRGERSMRNCESHAFISNSTCQSKGCNHFSLVNAGGGGYGSCGANLAWMPNLGSSVTTASGSDVRR